MTRYSNQQSNAPLAVKHRASSTGGILRRRRGAVLAVVMSFVAVANCSSVDPQEPVTAPIAHVEIATGVLDYVEIPIGGRTQVVVQARTDEGGLVRETPTPVLISRDTTRFVIEPGLWIRSVGIGGSSTVVARLTVNGRTLTDSVQVRVIVPLN